MHVCVCVCVAAALSELCKLATAGTECKIHCEWCVCAHTCTTTSCAAVQLKLHYAARCLCAALCARLRNVEQMNLNEFILHGVNRFTDLPLKCHIG
jgi:hypothetical protein